MSFERKQHAGGAITTTLASSITSGDTSLALAASTGWADGSVGPFYVVIDQGLANEEKILATSRTTLTLNSLTRGVDGTAAAAHASGATVAHCGTAVEFDEANQAAHATLGAITTKGDLLAGAGSQQLARVGVGADNTVVMADSGQTAGVKYAKIVAANITAGTITSTEIADATIAAADLASGAVTTVKLADGAVTSVKITPTYTAYTPTVTQSAIPTMTVNVARYVQEGKHVYGYVRCTVASGAGTGGFAVAIQLPATPNDASVPLGLGSVFDASTSIQFQGQLFYVGSGPAARILHVTDSVGQGFLGAQGFTAALAVGDVVMMQFDYESA